MANKELYKKIKNTSLLQEYSDAILEAANSNEILWKDYPNELCALPHEILIVLAEYANETPILADQLDWNLKLRLFSTLMHSRSPIDSATFDAELLKRWLIILKPKDPISVKHVNDILTCFKDSLAFISDHIAEHPLQPVYTSCKEFIANAIYSMVSAQPDLLSAAEPTIWHSLDSVKFNVNLSRWPTSCLAETYHEFASLPLTKQACEHLSERIILARQENKFPLTPLIAWDRLTSPDLTSSLLAKGIPFDGIIESSNDHFTYLIARIASKNCPSDIGSRIIPYLQDTNYSPLNAEQWSSLSSKIYSVHKDSPVSNIYRNLALIGCGYPDYTTLLRYIYTDRFDVANTLVEIGTPLDDIQPNGNSIWHDLLSANKQKELFKPFVSRRMVVVDRKHSAQFYKTLWSTCSHLINHKNNDGVTPIFMNNRESFCASSIFPGDSKKKLLSSLDPSISCTPLPMYTLKKWPVGPCSQVDYAKRIMSSYMTQKWDIERAWLMNSVEANIPTKQKMTQAL